MIWYRHPLVFLDQGFIKSIETPVIYPFDRPVRQQPEPLRDVIKFGPIKPIVREQSVE